MRNICTTIFVLILATGCRMTPPEPTGAALDLARTLAEAPAEAKREAAVAAFEAGPPAVLPVGELLGHEDPAVRKNAAAALWAIAHHAARRGTEDERKAVSLGCVALLNRAPALPQSGRELLLDVLSVTADDPFSVSEIAELLGDPEVGDAACRALERIPNTQATWALSKRVPEPRAVCALGAKRGYEAARALLAPAVGKDAEIARLARHSLARIGEREARNVLVAAADAGLPGAASDLLLFADRLVEEGHAAAARDLYRRFLTAADAHLRAAGAVGLGRAGAVTDIDSLCGLLDDEPAVRAAAERSLVGLDVEGTDLALLLAYEAAATATERQARLLHVLARRDAPGVDELIDAALDSPDETLRPEAIVLAGERPAPRFEEKLLAIAESAPERDRALFGLLEHAQRHLRHGDRDAALLLAHHALERGTDPELLAAALRLVGRVRDPRSLDQLARLENNGAVRDDLADARYEVAAALLETDPERAAVELEKVLFASGSRNRRRQAAEKLARLGVDTTLYPRRAGFLADWHLLGPLAEATTDDLGELPFDPAVSVGDPVVIDGEPLAWRPLHTDDLEGRVDLRAVFERKQNVAACAYTEFEAGPGPGLLLIGSDDGVAVWLNGRRVHENFAWRGLSVDEDRVPVTFVAGGNRLLVKVTQGGGDWGFCVRLADRDGRPIDRTAGP